MIGMEGEHLQVSEVLQKALRLMEQDGWCQNSYQNGMGHCAVGALWSVIGGEYEWMEGGRTLMMACLRALRGGTDIANIALWNDNPERTFSQVTEVYRRSICEAELREMTFA